MVRMSMITLLAVLEVEGTISGMRMMMRVGRAITGRQERPGRLGMS